MTWWATQRTDERKRAAVQAHPLAELPTSDTSSPLKISCIISYLQQEYTPQFPLKENITSTVTKIKPEHTVKVCSILVLAYPKNPSKCFILQPVQSVATTRALFLTLGGPRLNLSVSRNRMLSLTSILGAFSFLLNRLKANFISQRQNQQQQNLFQSIRGKPQWRSINQCKSALEATCVTTAPTLPRVKGAQKETRGRQSYTQSTKQTSHAE